MVMNQRQKSGMFKKACSYLHSLFSNLKPRYQLSLDNSSYDINLKKMIYCFKAFGDHSFVKLSYDQIKHNNDILYSINPHDLINISITEHLQNQKKTMLRISEILRENQYLLTEGDSSQIFSGEEICDNVILMERINNIDLYKIAYSTGFNRGRMLSKSVSKYTNEKKIINLSLVKNNSDKSLL
jgi:hypothetical protein